MTEVAVLRAEARYSLEQLTEMVAPLLDSAGVDRAIVFGSYARGQADGYSDFDLVVALSTDLPRWQRGALLKDVVEALPVPVDLLIYTPEEFRRGVDRGLGVFDAIAREGRTIYARSGS